MPTAPAPSRPMKNPIVMTESSTMPTQPNSRIVAIRRTHTLLAVTPVPAGWNRPHSGHRHTGMFSRSSTVTACPCRFVVAPRAERVHLDLPPPLHRRERRRFVVGGR